MRTAWLTRTLATLSGSDGWYGTPGHWSSIFGALLPGSNVLISSLLTP